jgi:diketogulonate reductase-like aldo/keto reductase
VIVKQKKFGNDGADVSVIGQGTWYLDRGDRKAAISALRHGIETGMTHIDTAEMYGEAEPVIADAIAGLSREKLFLVSKVLPSNASRRGTITACERSLKRLKTDHLDCYLLHWRGSYPFEETVAAFDELVAAGKIRSWGVSNFDADDLDELLDVAGEGKIACNQVLYHLQERAIEHAVIPWCEQHGVAVVAYSPFGHNDFPSARSKGGEVLQSIAQAHNATPRQVALAFLTRGPSVLAIPKASSAEHAADNAAAGDLALDAAEIAALDKAFPRGPKPRGLPML